MDFEFILINSALAASSFVSLWLIVRGNWLSGGLLLFSFISDQVYSLILVYGSGIAFSSSGMEAPLYIDVARWAAAVGHVFLPIGIWLLFRGNAQKRNGYQ